MNLRIDEILNSHELSSYRALRQQWKPCYVRIWIEMTAFLVGTGTTMLVFVQIDSSMVKALLFFPFAILVSLFKRAYLNFFHEAAHFNILPSQLWNDLLANLIFVPFTGRNIKDYRRHHWSHHRDLGGKDDSEVSYRSPLNYSKMIAALTGIYLIRGVLNFLNSKTGSQETKASTGSLFDTGKLIFNLGIAALFNTAICICLIVFADDWIAAGLWLFTVVSTDMLINDVRQTLEHRASNPRTPVETRAFGHTICARVIGSAGFNNHLLHHLDPSVSYTNFDDMSRALSKTQAVGLITASATTYLKTAAALWGK